MGIVLEQHKLKIIENVIALCREPESRKNIPALFLLNASRFLVQSSIMAKKAKKKYKPGEIIKIGQGANAVEINPAHVLKMAERGFTRREVADLYGVSVDSITIYFPGVFNSGAKRVYEIDKKELEKIKNLSAINCTDEEIASGLGVNYRTFKRRKAEDPRVQEAIEEGRNVGKISLRRKKWQLIESGNPTLIIWESKQRLGETDRQDITHRGDCGVMVVPAPLTTDDWDEAARQHYQRISEES